MCRRTALMAAAFGLCVWPMSARAAKAAVLYDGLYACYVPTNIGVTTSYLRFYPDGVVLAVTSLGTPKEVVKWFNRQKQPKYHYSVKGSSIRFEEKLDSLFFVYSGTIGGDFLTLRVDGYDRAKKRAMGYVERTYKFIPFESIR